MLPGFVLTYRKKHPRLTNHYGLALVSFLGCVVAKIIGGPDQPIFETISLGTGYVALLLVLLTLAIGPINMLKKRKNPVNMMFRRDAGIWAGITAILHVISSFTLYFGGNLLLYFFQQTDTGLGFSFDLFYLSDYVGLIAELVILFLLVLSNNYFLKLFKGPKWKQFQRFNYLLFGVALLHTLGQQLTNSRNPVLTFGVIGLSGMVVVAQSIGFVVYRRRDQQRKAASAAPATPRRTTTRGEVNPGLAPIPAPSTGRGLPMQPAYATVSVDKGLGRRRFLLVTGTVMLSGVVGGVSAKVIAKSNETAITTASNSTGEVTTPAGTSVTTGTTATTSAASPTTAAATTGSATSASSAGSSVTPTTSVATTTSGSAAATTSAATTTSGTAATTAVVTTSSATTAAPTGPVLANLANLAAGKAIAITTPDTKVAAFVIHRQDGTVTCFSGICTHEPVKLTFDASQQTLYCPKHGVPFDTQTGAPQRGPARTALAKYKVTVDSQGQVIYG